MINNVIKNIIQGNNLDDILNETLEHVYKDGPISVTDMEVLSYFAEYQPEVLANEIDKLLLYMGMYYKVKNVQPHSMKELIQTLYRDSINEIMGLYYTPVQANIVDGITSNRCFSFSAPTSTGKSFVFRNLISQSLNDVVIFVPSRALINEYYLFLIKEIPESNVNILTFVDKLNTAKATRSIFILTPERSNELFSRREEFNVDYFLFDEAQLGDEVSMRGLMFDSVVRRVSKYYPDAKLVFTQPFVSNPEAQFVKNAIQGTDIKACSYKQKNVGQLFYCYDKDTKQYFHFGIDKTIMGNRHIINEDPISSTLKNGGSVLFYVSKSNIIHNNVYLKFSQYINLCRDINADLVRIYVDRMKEYTGADMLKDRLYYSSSLALLKKGVVVHHGSMPLKMRSIIEDFIKAGLCRICFATSTVEQGVNMPFDTVYIDRFEQSKPLAIKNLIGRAGRSTHERKLDVGKVVIRRSNVSEFRKIINNVEVMRCESLIEKPDPKLGDDFNDFRDSIINGTYNEEYNMTSHQLDVLSDDEIQQEITDIVYSVIGEDNKLINIFKLPVPLKNKIFTTFEQIYCKHLGRDVTMAEEYVLLNAIHIMFFRMYVRKFSTICKIRYDTLCQTRKCEKMKKSGIDNSKVKVDFLMGYSDLPNLSLRVFPLVQKDVLVSDVDFDTVIYDTYDYLDKLIGFKLSDIYYAAFKVNYESTQNNKSLIMANLIKYGTADAKEIFMMRYGLSFEDISVLGDCIDTIDETCVQVNNSFYNLPEDIRKPLERFVSKD